MANVVINAVEQTGLNSHVYLDARVLGQIREMIYYHNAERYRDPFMGLVNALRSINAGGSNNPVEDALVYIENLQSM